MIYSQWEGLDKLSERLREGWGNIGIRGWKCKKMGSGQICVAFRNSS